MGRNTDITISRILSHHATLFWDKENNNYRTIDCNQALSIIQRISSGYKNKNEEDFPSNNHSLPFPKGGLEGMSISLRSIRTKKEQSFELLFFVRIKGLEPPRLSAPDPKSDVATNYTISASFAQQNYIFFINYKNLLHFSSV